MSICGDIFDICKEVAKKVFGSVSIVNDLHIDKKAVKLSAGIKISSIFSAIVDIKIDDDISIITFYLNNKKHKLYLASNKMLLSFRTALIFIKSIITGDKDLQKQFNALSISKKQYKEMKKRAKNIKRKIKSSVKKEKGALVIRLGKRKKEVEEYFDPALNW